MEALDRACGFDSWGPLGDGEWALLLPPVGYALWAAVPGLGEAELLRVAVSPGRRRSGLGRGLLQASEPLLREQGVRTLLLEVRVANDSARALYAALGWEQVGLRKGYYRDGEDAVLYRKELRG
jgi:ribosomal protein S18 acetylase RimI-like enzyme